MHCPDRRVLTMITKVLVVLLTFIACTGPAIARDDIALLVADFDSKTVDQPIGTGGPSAGEPNTVDPMVTAIVRAAPFESPCLEIRDNDTFAAGTVRFDFVDGNELTTGTVTFDADLWFDALENFNIYIRESGSSAASFLNLGFGDDGSVFYNDKNPGGLLGTYTAGAPVHLKLVFRMEEGTYDIRLGGVDVLTERAHGVTERGVGAILFGTAHDADLEGTFFIDNVSASGTGVSPTKDQSWGSTKASFR